jgi:hypothetical protein
MIEIPGDVGSVQSIDNQKTVGETEEEKENLCNQAQFNINQEIGNTYFKRNGSKYIIKWLHSEPRNKEEIQACQTYWEKFNQLLELRDVLYKSILNIVQFFATGDKIDIYQNAYMEKRIRFYPIKNDRNVTANELLDD